ncbi:hypothetical protein PENARI_c002G06673 [Penicillium arizonense]|uniref:Uncharacterized protein n=1 Tax=Penicillium arizonense TaxID=1835702 RepID=A0A1F5LWN7_PENAI|nr:hypothetical protein PENARI_c002G06673 [Penicillium arizonense]OGE57567.1 hypothetical protein PENARI_c002G06673 [Penicillium arizonense]
MACVNDGNEMNHRGQFLVTAAYIDDARAPKTTSTPTQRA